MVIFPYSMFGTLEEEESRGEGGEGEERGMITPSPLVLFLFFG